MRSRLHNPSPFQQETVTAHLEGRLPGINFGFDRVKLLLGIYDSVGKHSCATWANLDLPNFTCQAMKGVNREPHNHSIPLSSVRNASKSHFLARTSGAVEDYTQTTTQTMATMTHGSRTDSKETNGSLIWGWLL